MSAGSLSGSLFRIPMRQHESHTSNSGFSGFSLGISHTPYVRDRVECGGEFDKSDEVLQAYWNLVQNTDVLNIYCERPRTVRLVVQPATYFNGAFKAVS